MFHMMNEARAICALQGESQANLSYLMSAQYSRQRPQFEKSIIEHPDVKRTLLKMRAMGRGLRSLCLYVAKLFDAPVDSQKEAQELIGLLTPICKSFCTDEGFQVTVDAIQVHGGCGF